MKLFNVTAVSDYDYEYLTVGSDTDTSETIIQRELHGKLSNYDCLYNVFATEINEVDGYKIIVQ